MLQLPAIKNLSAQQCSLVTPWLYKPTSKPPKPTWNKSSLDHCFYNGFTGICSEMRIGADNPPARMYALVIDYDTENGFSQAVFDDAINQAGEIKPSHIGHTYHEGARAVYPLEKPLPLVNAALTKLITKYFGEKLQVIKLFAGRDLPALTDVTKYYEVGTQWKQVSNDVIPFNLAVQWSIEATRTYNWVKHDFVVPLDKIKAELDTRFPGRWKGEFELGSRDVRFWDETADNDTGAVVRESGMQCFTGPVGFMTWRDIFGAKFVNQFIADKVATSTADIWFDGREYWVKSVTGCWNALTRQDVMLHLKVAGKLSARVAKGENQSEVESALHHIQHHQAIECAAPLVHQPEGLVYTEIGRILNTSKLKAITPVEAPNVVPETDFPFISEYLANLFTPTKDGTSQLQVCLSWLKRGYTGAYRKALKSSQVMYLVGPTGRGKTLFNTVLVSGLMGGHVDASPYLTGMDDWNSHLFESAVWSIDDVVALKDQRAHERFSSLLKKIAANTTFTIAEKYRKARQVIWNGLLLISCNDDPESSRILPDCDHSNRDKIIMLKVAAHNFVFPDDCAQRIRAELPAFARFLLNWEIPEELVGESRYGIKAYAEPSLVDLSRFGSRSYGFYELLQVFFKHQPKDQAWTGIATDLFTELLAESGGIAEIAKRYTHIQFGRELGKLMSAGYPISQQRTAQGRVWTIHPAFYRSREV